jgi:radical SAM protein with 4Fe4S-binding SPASM domain
MAESTFNLQDMQKVLSVFPNLESVNFGTGESILNKQFKEIVDLFYARGVKLAVTSNGLSLNTMDEETLKKFADVDVSIDFPDAAKHDEWRGKKGLFQEAIQAIERCKKYNINVSVVSVLMSNNYSDLPGFKKILDKYDINLRINLYKSVSTDEFTPTYDQFWSAIEGISRNFEVESCSEPILSLVYDDVPGGSRCGSSVRIHPDGEVSSCVYVKDGLEPETFNNQKKEVLDFCQSCPVRSKCVGGCYGRRTVEERSKKPDTYCPYYNNKPLPQFKLKKKKGGHDLIHSSYLCTIILR